METRTLNDIYRCPHCRAIAAHGDPFCRGCGVRFNSADVAAMRRDVRSPFGALPWNTRDRFRCVHCEKHISIRDAYCRGCGDKIDDQERQLMRLRLSELARQNTRPLIVLGFLVFLVVLFSIALVRH